MQETPETNSTSPVSHFIPPARTWQLYRARLRQILARANSACAGIDVTESKEPGSRRKDAQVKGDTGGAQAT
jgi:hypothetical protein